MYLSCVTVGNALLNCINFNVVLGTVVPFGLFVWGVHQIPARVATLVAMIEPVCGAIFAIFLVGQLLSPLAVLGGAMILCGVWLNTIGGVRVKS